MSLGINDFKASLSEGDSLLKYFIKEAHLYPTITCSTRYNQFITIQLDHAFPLIKNNIDSFLQYQKVDILWNIDTAERELVRPIYNEINSLKKIDPIKRSENELKRILSLISAFPNSKEKVWLILQYYSLNLFDHPTYNNFCLACSKAKESADLINDLFEKGWAYMYIGDFAKDQGNNGYSLTIYNFAQELFYRCDQDSTVKYNFQGWICEKIAKLFPNAGTDIIPGINKQSNYYLAASDFFVYGKDSIRANENFSKFTLNYAYVASQSDFDNKYSITPKQIEAKVLHLLAYWYQSNFRHNKDFTATNSRSLYSIGIILEGEHKMEEAKTFYLLSLLPVSGRDDISDIISILCKLSIIHAKLGKKILAFKYSDLIFNIAEKTDNNIYYAKALLNKATVFFALKRYDSAIVYTNKITDAFAVESYDAPTYTEIAEEAYKLKASASQVLKSDSAWIYKAYYNSYRKTHYDELANVLISESEAIAGWLDEVESKEISIEKDQTAKVEALNEKISESNLKLEWVAGALGGAAIIIGFLYFILRKRSKQLLISTTSDLRLRSAIKNHNLGNHYAKIKVMLRENRIKEADDYCEANSTYFDKFYNLILEDIIPLQQELEVLSLFVETERIFKKMNIEILYRFENIDIQKTSFLSDIFVPLYENALLKGFTKKDKEYRFTIEMYHSDSILHCRIFDNGEGVNNINSVIRTNSFLDMLNKRLHHYFEIKNKPLHEKSVFDIKSEIGEGTQIKFIMPYDTIKNLDSRG